jgi:hypothetical protein
VKRDTLHIAEVATYLRATHQRVAEMYAEGKLPEPDRVELYGLGPSWKPFTIARWAEGEWWGTRGWNSP